MRIVILMGKGAPKPPPPIPPVLADNLGNEADSAVRKKKQEEEGINFDDTLIGGDLLGSKSLLGSK